MKTTLCKCGSLRDISPDYAYCRKCANEYQHNRRLRVGPHINTLRRASYRRDPRGNLLVTTRNRAKQKQLPFNLDKNDIVIPTTCPILGIQLEIGSYTTQDNSPSLDRLIPNLGYVKGNVIVISHKANRMKSNATLEDLERLVDYVKKSRPINH